MRSYRAVCIRVEDEHACHGGNEQHQLQSKVGILNKIVQSFSRSGRPHDNAVTEAFFSALKKEELYRTNFQSEREFYKSVDSYIKFYNTERPHGTLNYKTPEQFEKLYLEKKTHAA